MKNRRLMLVYSLIIFFAGWLCMVAFWYMPKMAEWMTAPDSLDMILAIMSSFGIGGVTNLFIVLLTLSWRYYFGGTREEETTETPAVG